MTMTKPEAVVWSIVAAALAGVIALAVFARRGDAPVPVPPPFATMDGRAGVAPVKTSELLPASAGELGSFPCVERSGRAMNTADLRGKFVVADFIFTSCSGPCPMMSAAVRIEAILR